MLQISSTMIPNLAMKYLDACEHDRMAGILQYLRIMELVCVLVVLNDAKLFAKRRHHPVRLTWGPFVAKLTLVVTVLCHAYHGSAHSLMMRMAAAVAALCAVHVELHLLGIWLGLMPMIPRGLVGHARWFFGKLLHFSYWDNSVAASQCNAPPTPTTSDSFDIINYNMSAKAVTNQKSVGTDAVRPVNQNMGGRNMNNGGWSNKVNSNENHGFHRNNGGNNGGNGGNNGRNYGRNKWPRNNNRNRAPVPRVAAPAPKPMTPVPKIVTEHGVFDNAILADDARRFAELKAYHESHPVVQPVFQDVWVPRNAAGRKGKAVVRLVDFDGNEVEKKGGESVGK